LLYLAWAHGGENPFRLYHGLDEQYRPIGGGEPKLPAFPARVRAFIYGCAQQAKKDMDNRAQAGMAAGM
jgi:hypothetical protein